MTKCRFLKILCALCVLSGVTSVARGEDSITLTDGRVIKGEISHEDGDAVYLKLPGGEARAIAKTRISKIDREKKIVGPQPAKGTDIPAAPKQPDSVQPPEQKDVTKIYSEIKDLGSSDLARRKAALELIKEKKAEAIPVMLGMLNPKIPSDEWTHIGILRALGDLGPLSEQAAQTIAWVTMNDPYPEARREACNTIRRTQDDRAIRHLIALSTSQNGTQRGGTALHEIDDNRVLAALVRAIPMPNVTANVSDPNRGMQPDYNLPIGPYGAKMPLFLPKSDVQGVATDLDSPAAQLLKQIAGKDLGNLPYGWINWYREKMGEVTADDRESWREKRSVRDRINAP